MRLASGRSRAGFAIGVAGLLLGSGAASAQRGSSQYGQPEPTPQNMATLAVKRSSLCAYKAASATADKVLRAPLASDEEARQVRSLRGVARSCYGFLGNLPAPVVHGSLAEVVYAERHRSPPPPLAATRAPPESFAIVPPGTRGRPEQEVAWSLGALARCVVFVDNGGAHQFITGPTAVAEEQRRFDLLKPAIQRCSDAQVAGRVTPQTMRGFVAMALLEQVDTAR